MNNKVTFKPYYMNQLKLPIDLGIDIPENHLVKIVNRAIEWMDLTPLLKKYKGGKIAREAREKLELQTGQKVVTDSNFLPASKKPKQIKKKD